MPVSLLFHIPLSDKVNLRLRNKGAHAVVVNIGI